MGHLSALLKKNMILWRRGGICAYCEIILPLLFCLFFFLMRSLADREDIEKTSYISYDADVNPYIPYTISPEFSGTTASSYDDIISQGIWIQNCINNKRSGELRQNGHIALSPEGNVIIEELKDQIVDMGYTYEYYQDKNELLNYIKSEEYEDNVCIGISFDEANANTQWTYSLHFNTTSPTDPQIPTETYTEDFISYKIENIEDFTEPWIESGFLTLQNWIDNEIAKQEKTASYPITPTVTSMTVEAHVNDGLPDIMVGNFSTFTTLPLIVVFLRFLYQIVSEKEQKIREQMRIMGLSDVSFYMSWIIQYSIIYFIIAVITCIICAITIFSHSDYVLMLVWYYLFCLNCIVQALLISTFFSKAKIANIVGLVIYLGFYIITMVIGNNQGLSTGARAALSIFPQVNQSISADVFVLIETKDQGIGWDDLTLEVEKYYIGISLIMYLLSLAIQILLFLYLDQVLPSDFGVRRHPLFCLGFKKKNITNNKEDDQLHKQKDENIEDVEQYLKQLQQQKECLEIKNMGKIYPNGKRAVNNLSLTMFRDQIFCLLGHNGSGKSTSISMLTGMTSMTEGEANVFGYDVQTDLDKIRKIMGICPQHDILFENLTVYEHLKLFATIKGRTDQEEIEKEINSLLDDVDLQFKRNALSKTLSGGQKRRLSVAMAFVGGSKIIYLDEPTSGCDTSVRRHIWEMLKKYKQGRIMVLTTHFMDEADYLGDRISIIGEGKLICTGSPNFLKTKFGVGYNLTVVKNDPTAPADKIINIIKKHIPDVKKPKVTSAEISFQLNMSEVSKFQNLFEDIDSQKQQLDISNYGISITTMEQVFLEVSERNSTTKDEEDDLEKIRNSSLIDNQDNFNLNDVRIKNNCQIFNVHFWALVMKRINYFKRDKKGLACEVFIPCLMLIFGLYATTVQKSYEDDPFLLGTDILDFDIQTIYAGDLSKSQLDSILDYFTDKYEFLYTDKSTINEWDDYVFENKNDDILGAYYVTSYDATAGADYTLEISSLYRDALPLYVNSMNEALIRQATNNKNLQINTIVHPFPLTAKLNSLVSSTMGIGVAFTFALLLSFIPSSLVSFIIKERQDQVKHQQVVSGISLKAYWISNYFIDMVKYIFPVFVLSLILIFAYGVDSYTEEGDVFAAVALLLLLYGISIIPFTYVFSFILKTPGNGQVLVFFLCYISGGLLPMVVWMFRVFFESTRDIFTVIMWILRIFPSFSLGMGLMNIASRETYLAFFDDINELQGPFHINIALGDLIMMIIMTIVYSSMILLFERLKSKGTLDKFMASRAGYPQFQPVLQDDDVQKEQEIVEKSSIQDYVIRLNKVRKVFKTIDGKYLEAVKQVSVGIKKGECFALLGINGAGKTTLFKILSGDHQTTSGQAHINGYDVSTEMEVARYAIGYCPQFDALLDNLTTREHLELYAAIKGIPQNMRKELVDHKIHEMNLKKFENIPAGTYSGGNKRKLSVAIAMIGNPPVVLLDEPSTGMDPKARRFMWSVISRISTKRKSSSIVLTTHSMEEAEALSTKMVIMVEGLFKCMGSIQNIKSKFGQGYEIEVKVKIPKQAELEKKIGPSDLPLDYAITPETIQQTLQKLNWSDYLSEIAPQKSANELYVSLQSSKGLSLQHLVEFFLIEQQTKVVEDYIKQKFQKYSVIEHYGSFTRYKIETSESTGKIFGTFEAAKKDLEVIDAYSVKQATIEAIFNQFATHQIKTEDFNRGGKFYKGQDQNQNQNQRNQENLNDNQNQETSNLKSSEKYIVNDNKKSPQKSVGTEKVKINRTDSQNNE